MVDMKELGKNIRATRKMKGLTQEELAKKTDLSTMSIRRYEAGERVINESALRRIALALNVNPIELYPEDERADAVMAHLRWKLRGDFSSDELPDALSEIPEEYRGDAVMAIAIDRLARMGLTLTDGDKVLIQGNGEPWLKVPVTPKDRVEAAFERLSPEGQQAAAERLEELALLEKYKKKEPSDGS